MFQKSLRKSQCLKRIASGDARLNLKSKAAEFSCKVKGPTQIRAGNESGGQKVSERPLNSLLASGNINELVLRGSFELLASGNTSATNHQKSSDQKFSRKVLPSVIREDQQLFLKYSVFAYLNRPSKSLTSRDNEDNSNSIQGNSFQAADHTPQIVNMM
ncbi:hypothetical protein STEG23_013617, partial [Scotinomys teguina]